MTTDTQPAPALPTWEEMTDVDKGCALLHLWKREWEGSDYAVAEYPCRYLDDPRLTALTPREACRHAVDVAASHDAVTALLGEDEHQRLYDLALERTEPLDLAALRALCDAATPAPWLPAEFEPEHVLVTVRGDVVAGNYDSEVGGIVEPADLALIAAARNALPGLLAEVERLTFAEGGIRDAAIAYVRAAEDDPELVEGGLYRDLVSAVDHWVAVTARLEAAAESPGGTR